ncbi:hypothetical protein CK203_111993 [Vitis vinifera]|uniref:Retrotransposon gag domain-containing protein n=1 Tax=Vitis vinifera TaxID=29760 RepID=A0A438C4Q4_VITVI|nr:hypothetical protein CK203_111993 [Vitis vinifera]
MKNPSLGSTSKPLAKLGKVGKAISSKMEGNRAFRKAKSSNSQEDEWLSFTFLGVMEARQEENFNAYRSMRDRMHPPRMSALSCIVPPTEQLVIRPHIVPFIPTFHEMESENPILTSRSLKTLKDKAKDQWLKRQISNFSTKENEKFYECWERYMEAINACPHHGFDTWLLVSYFYDGMSSFMKQLLETMCGGDFMSKNPEEAMDFLSYVSEVSRGWDEPNTRDMGRMKSQPNAKGGMYVLSEDMDMKAKFATMARRLEELELKKVQECPTIPAVREMFGDQANVVDQLKPNNYAPYGSTYNSNWRNHPNFSWKPRPPQYKPPTQAPQQASNLEQAIVNLSKAHQPQYYARERKVSFSTSSKSQGIHEVEAQEGESSKVREVKAVITLRSGKEVVRPAPKLKHDEGSESEKDMGEKKSEEGDHDSSVDEEPRIVIKEDMMKKHMPPPFPQALHGKKGTKNTSENFEVLRQVKVNIPLLDMIKQVPTYEKFLKDLCTVKRGLNVTKKAFLIEQVSAIIQSSVNLLPIRFTSSWDLGGLKPTSITLSLADRSVKIPRGIIEDVLVQVDKFYYLGDFVVLDTDPIVMGAKYVPIILGRLFLATSNVISNCRNGVMQLTFGNMTLELNIFYLCKKHLHLEEEERPEEVCMIDTLVEERCEQSMEEDLIKSLGDLDEGLPEPSDLLTTMSHWRKREEILPLFNEEESHRVGKEEPPKLTLKLLPNGLKYAYLEEDKQCPMVISSALSIHQEDCLIRVLRRCKKAIGWKILDLKGISPLVCTHHIYMEEEAKPVHQP